MNSDPNPCEGYGCPCHKIEGKRCYESYRTAVNNMSCDNKPLKDFDDLPYNIQQAWEYSANEMLTGQRYHKIALYF